ncbi:hypothetical protein QQ045_013243 [Rhodiola kirilowii]
MMMVAEYKNIRKKNDDQEQLPEPVERKQQLSAERDYTAKLSDFDLAKDGPEGDQTHVSTHVMGTESYAAPEYFMTSHLTLMSDVYIFGVVLPRTHNRPKIIRHDSRRETTTQSADDFMMLRILPLVKGNYAVL